MTNKTVILGDEFDDELRSKLQVVLRSLGASGSDSHDWRIAGSQEVETFTAVIDGHKLKVEAETYVGLSITGPSILIDKVKRLIAA